MSETTYWTETTPEGATRVGIGSPPEGAQILDASDYHALLGATLGADAEPLDLAAYAKRKRDETEAAGVTLSGLAIASDPDSQTRVANAYAGMQVAGVASIRFKASAGFVVLTFDQVKAVGAALFAHTQACFDAEDRVDAALNASPPTITTAAQVDAVFAAVPSAY